MSKTSFNSFRPNVETLEDRQMLSGTTLSAGIRPAPNSPTQAQIYIDGSDYDDHITIMNYNRALGSVDVKLESWYHGSLVSRRTVHLHAQHLVAPAAIYVEGRGGADQIGNNTSLMMEAHGGDGDDLIVGGSSIDRLYGDANNDVLRGRGGYDNLYGGTGDDTLVGGDGSDALYGGADNDHLYGDTEDNTFLIGNSNWLYGEDGNDTLVGGTYDDTLEGGNGDDYLYGRSGDDTLRGGDGADHLFGEDGNDYLDGGYWSEGNINRADNLVGGRGNDRFVRHRSVFGGDDTDNFLDYYGPSGDRIVDVWHAW